MARQDKRQRIMQAAEKLFARGQFHEITTDDVAREAHVGKGTIYRHFQDKDDLFFETANAGFDEVCDLVGQGVPPGAGFSEQLLGACVRISDFFQRRREMFAMMQFEDGRMTCFTGRLLQRWLERRKKLVDAVADILRVGVREGAIRSDILPEVLANFLLGMLRTRARDLREYPESARQHECVVEVFCRGAGTPAGAIRPRRLRKQVRVVCRNMLPHKTGKHGTRRMESRP